MPVSKPNQLSMQPTCQRGQLVHARRIAVAGVQQQQAAQVLGAREALMERGSE